MKNKSILLAITLFSCGNFSFISILPNNQQVQQSNKKIEIALKNGGNPLIICAQNEFYWKTYQNLAAQKVSTLWTPSKHHKENPGMVMFVGYYKNFTIRIDFDGRVIMSPQEEIIFNFEKGIFLEKVEYKQQLIESYIFSQTSARNIGSIHKYNTTTNNVYDQNKIYTNECIVTKGKVSPNDEAKLIQLYEKIEIETALKNGGNPLEICHQNLSYWKIYKILAEQGISTLWTPEKEKNEKPGIVTFTRYYDNFTIRIDADGRISLLPAEYITNIIFTTNDPLERLFESWVFSKEKAISFSNIQYFGGEDKDPVTGKINRYNKISMKNN